MKFVIIVALLTLSGRALAADCQPPADINARQECTQWMMTCGADAIQKQMTPFWKGKLSGTPYTPMEMRFMAEQAAFDKGAKLCQSFDFVQAKAVLDRTKSSLPAQ